MRYVAAIFVLSGGVVATAGCSAEMSSGDPYADQTTLESLDTRADGAASSLGALSDEDSSVPVGADGDALADAAVARRLIFRGEMSVVVEDVVAASDDISTWVGERGGFIEGSSSTEYDDRPSMYLVLRVPSDDYEALRDHVAELAVAIESDQSNRDDVTAQYADNAARLETMRLAEAELRELLATQNEEGGNLETVLSIHRELRSLRTEIDGLQAQLDVLEEQVALSTLSVRLSSESTLVVGSGRAWRLRSTFVGATHELRQNVQGFTEGLVYFLVAVLPMILLWSVALGAGLWLAIRVARLLGLRRTSLRRSSRRSKEASEVEDNLTAGSGQEPPN